MSETTETTEVATHEEPMELAESANGNVSRLVELAIREKVDVGVLERLVDLQERVMERDARAAFFEALNAFQEEVPEIAKSKTAEVTTKSGGRYSYTYAPLEEITRTIRPVLKDHGLSYSWTTDPGERDDILNVVCILRHVAGHEERAVFPVPTQTDAAMSGAQKQGAALTYGRRQSLEAVLGLTTSDDVDGAGQAQPIGEWEYEKLDDMLEETGADRRKFLDWLGVEALEDLTMDQYPTAFDALKRKKRKIEEAMAEADRKEAEATA